MRVVVSGRRLFRAKKSLERRCDALRVRDHEVVFETLEFDVVMCADESAHAFDVGPRDDVVGAAPEDARSRGTLRLIATERVVRRRLVTQRPVALEEQERAHKARLPRLLAEARDERFASDRRVASSTAAHQERQSDTMHEELTDDAPTQRVFSARTGTTVAANRR